MLVFSAVLQNICCYHARFPDDESEFRPFPKTIELGDHRDKVRVEFGCVVTSNRNSMTKELVIRHALEVQGFI